jgi:hypothetical protein
MLHPGLLVLPGVLYQLLNGRLHDGSQNYRCMIRHETVPVNNDFNPTSLSLELTDSLYEWVSGDQQPSRAHSQKLSSPILFLVSRDLALVEVQTPPCSLRLRLFSDVKADGG